MELEDNVLTGLLEKTIVLMFADVPFFEPIEPQDIPAPVECRESKSSSHEDAADPLL